LNIRNSISGAGRRHADWLTDQYHPLLITSAQVRASAVKVTQYLR
jgi:hypothetical protein